MTFKTLSAAALLCCATAALSACGGGVYFHSGDVEKLAVQAQTDFNAGDPSKLLATESADLEKLFAHEAEARKQRSQQALSTEMVRLLNKATAADNYKSRIQGRFVDLTGADPATAKELLGGLGPNTTDLINSQEWNLRGAQADFDRTVVTYRKAGGKIAVTCDAKTGLIKYDMLPADDQDSEDVVSYFYGTVAETCAKDVKNAYDVLERDCAPIATVKAKSQNNSPLMRAYAAVDDFKKKAAVQKAAQKVAEEQLKCMAAERAKIGENRTDDLVAFGAYAKDIFAAFSAPDKLEFKFDDVWALFVKDQEEAKEKKPNAEAGAKCPFITDKTDDPKKPAAHMIVATILKAAIELDVQIGKVKPLEQPFVDGLIKDVKTGTKAYVDLGQKAAQTKVLNEKLSDIAAALADWKPGDKDPTSKVANTAIQTVKLIDDIGAITTAKRDAELEFKQTVAGYQSKEAALRAATLTKQMALAQTRTKIIENELLLLGQAYAAGDDEMQALDWYARSYRDGRLPLELNAISASQEDIREAVARAQNTLTSRNTVVKMAVDQIAAYSKGGITPQDILEVLQTMGIAAVAVNTGR